MTKNDILISKHPWILFLFRKIQIKVKVKVKGQKCLKMQRVFHNKYKHMRIGVK